MLCWKEKKWFGGPGRPVRAANRPSSPSSSPLKLFLSQAFPLDLFFSLILSFNNSLRLADCLMDAMKADRRGRRENKAGTLEMLLRVPEGPLKAESRALRTSRLFVSTWWADTQPWAAKWTLWKFHPHEAALHCFPHFITGSTAWSGFKTRFRKNNTEGNISCCKYLFDWVTLVISHLLLQRDAALIAFVCLCK